MSRQIDVNSSRLELLKRRQWQFLPEYESNSKLMMKLTLYEAITKGDVGAFINTMEQASTEMQLPLSAIVMHLSPAGNSLLHVAVAFGHKELTTIVASHFPLLLSMKNILGDTTLHVASKKGNLEIVRIVVAAFEDHFPTSMDSIVRMQNEYGNTALHDAVLNGKAGVVDFLVNKDPETWYQQNNEGKSPLYLAVQSGDLGIVKILLNAPVTEVVGKLQGHSPVHAAIMERSIDMLKEVLDRRPELFQLKDVKRRSPLHLAAHMGYVDGVKFLLSESICSAFEYDEDGQLPIHAACKVVGGPSVSSTVELMKELLGQWPDPLELLDEKGRSILHSAAMSGRAGVVKKMLKMPQLELLINQRDKDGNTAIHLAAFNWHPPVLYYLALDRRAKVNLVNKQCFTAYDFVCRHISGYDEPLRKWITLGVVYAAGGSRSNDLVISNAQGWNLECGEEPPSMEFLKDKANSRMIMAALVATVSFAASFLDPGGSDQSNPVTSRMNRELLGIFVISNTIAMYSSVLVIFMSIWAQLGDPYAAMWALKLARVPLYTSLVTMSLAFMAGMHVAMAKHSSLATIVFIMGTVSISLMLIIILMLYPLIIKQPVLRQMSYVSMLLGFVISGSRHPLPSKPNLVSTTGNSHSMDLEEHNKSSCGVSFLQLERHKKDRALNMTFG